MRMLPLILVAVSMAMGAWAAGDGVRIGMLLEPPGLDPIEEASASVDEILYTNVLEGLTRYAQDESIEPALARSWDISEDGKIYTFHLVKNAEFHNGKPFTAQAVKSNLDRMLQNQTKTRRENLSKYIKETRIVDKNTFAIELLTPNSDILRMLAVGEAVILEPSSIPNAKERPIGTGPFRFSFWNKGSKITLTQAAEYWGEAAKLDWVEFHFITDPTAALNALMLENLDAIPKFQTPERLPLLKQDGRFNIVIGTTEGETILAMNHKNPLLADKRIREAIAHAIDRDLLIKAATAGYGVPIGTHFPPQNPAYVNLLDLSSYDLQRSADILSKVAPEKDLRLTLKLPPTSYARRSGEIIAAELDILGITVDIVNIDWNTWITDVFTNHDYDLTIISHIEPMDVWIYGDPEYYFGYDNPQVREILDNLRASIDEEDQRKFLGEFQTAIAEDYANGYLFQLAQIGIYNKNLRGYWEDIPTPVTNMTKVYWADE